MMKIAFIGDRLGLATGGNLYIARVAEELAALGTEVTLITLVPPQDIPWPANLRVLSRPVDFSFGQRPEKGRIKSFLHSRLAAVTELKALVRQRYDILYSVGGPSNIVNRLCRSGPFPPRVSVAAIFHLFRQTPYRQFLIDSNTYKKPFQTIYHSWGDRLAKDFFVVTISEFWRNKLISRGFDKEKIRVIPVGADWENWPSFPMEEAKKKLNLGHRLVIYTSPLRLNKGIINVLKAVELLKNQFPALLVLATGVTDLQTQRRVREFIRVHRMENHFRYDGLLPRDQLPFYYAAADIVALVSLEEEGWGITLLEGMISGRPIIGSPMGALTELVQDRGLLLEKNTPQDLARTVKHLLESPDLRDQLARAGPPYARRFSYRATARAHLDWFEELLAKKR
jgi:glycosyltransferase involved in cell wall biosynthesis